MGLKLDVKRTVQNFENLIEPISIKKTRATVFLPDNDVNFIRSLGDGNFNRGICILLSPYEDLEITNVENLCMLQLKKETRAGLKGAKNDKKNHDKKSRGKTKRR